MWTALFWFSSYFLLMGIIFFTLRWFANRGFQKDEEWKVKRRLMMAVYLIEREKEWR